MVTRRSLGRTRASLTGDRSNASDPFTASTFHNTESDSASCAKLFSARVSNLKLGGAHVGTGFHQL